MFFLLRQPTSNLLLFMYVTYAVRTGESMVMLMLAIPQQSGTRSLFIYFTVTDVGAGDDDDAPRALSPS